MASAYYFACNPHEYRELTTPRPFLEEASVEARNMLSTFVEFVGTDEARKLLSEKDWACWVEFGLPTSVTPATHEKPPHPSESDLTLLDMQLARKGAPSVAKLWSTLYGYRGLLKTIFKPTNLRLILRLMETLSNDTETGPTVPESISIKDKVSPRSCGCRPLRSRKWCCFVRNRARWSVRPRAALLWVSPEQSPNVTMLHSGSLSLSQPNQPP